MKLLENKTAIITGASRGIGRGIAQTLAKHGCSIAFTFNTNIEAAKSLVNELLRESKKRFWKENLCRRN